MGNYYPHPTSVLKSPLFSALWQKYPVLCTYILQLVEIQVDSIPVEKNWKFIKMTLIIKPGCIIHRHNNHVYRGIKWIYYAFTTSSITGKKC
jgi:hypothetical protein